MAKVNDLVKKDPLLIYFVLTFAVSWRPSFLSLFSLPSSLSAPRYSGHGSVGHQGEQREFQKRRAGRIMRGLGVFRKHSQVWSMRLIPDQLPTFGETSNFQVNAE